MNGIGHEQRGATLVIALVLLLIITVLGISNMREVTLEERIVGNLRDKQAALNGAESALREGEKSLSASAGPASTTSMCAKCYLETPPAVIPTQDWGWWKSHAPYKGTGSATDLHLADDPYWLSSFLGYDPADSTARVEVSDTELRSRGVGPYYYQVIAASKGRSERITVTLQSTIVERY